jgi:hypothetical protein
VSPDREALLAAVARWVDQDARPALPDPGLQFRARVAAALLRAIAAESAASESLETADVARLRGLLAEIDRSPRLLEDIGDEAPAPQVVETESARRAALRMLERVLCDRVRGGLDRPSQARARAVVRDGLRARLAVTTPDLELAEDVE